MPAKSLDQLTSQAAHVIVAELPERIKTALIERAAEMNYLVDAATEMALAHYLDHEAIGFVDCNPKRGR